MRPTDEQFQQIATLTVKLIRELEGVDQLLEYMELNEETDLYQLVPNKKTWPPITCKNGRFKAEGRSTPLWNARPDNAEDAVFARICADRIQQDNKLSISMFSYREPALQFSLF